MTTHLVIITRRIESLVGKTMVASCATFWASRLLNPLCLFAPVRQLNQKTLIGCEELSKLGERIKLRTLEVGEVLFVGVGTHPMR
jgi:hypothetical protein